jgi:hypothetical protein
MVSRLVTDSGVDTHDIAAQIRRHPDPQLILYRIGAIASAERTALPVLSRLAASGFDLQRVAVDAAALKTGRLGSIIPGFTPDGASLADLLEAVRRHQRMLRSVVNEIGELRPDTFLIAYGLGIDLACARSALRQSSDVDVFSATPHAADDLSDLLVRRSGFVLEAAIRPAASPDLGVWKLVARRSAHLMQVDLFAGGRASTGHSWIPPFREPRLFTQARPLPSGPAVLVAAPEEMLLMLAEKTLRKGEYTDRRAEDCRSTLADHSDMDWDKVVEAAHRHHVELPLRWLLQKAVSLAAEVPRAVFDELAVPGWERRILSVITTARPRTRQRARATHRWLWVARYVRGSPARIRASREVLAGRYSREALRRASR